MARKSKEAEQEYQRAYYEERIKNDDEARERKNARQREYAKRTGYAADMKYKKSNTKQIPLRLNYNTDADILAKLESVENTQGYIKKLIRDDIEKN